MRYLLDTNVLSELRKPERRVDPNVRAWVASRAASDLYLCVITILEIEVGIGRLERRDVSQARLLRRWLEDEVLDLFGGRILPVDVDVARRAAKMHVPDPRPERDALIGAAAALHNMTMVTRNTADFEPMGVEILDPWRAL